MRPVVIASFWFFLALLCTPLLGAEIRCGPEIVTVGDAWNMIQSQTEAVQRALASGDAVPAVQSATAIHEHLRFMRRGAIMLFGKRLRFLNSGVEAAELALVEMGRGSARKDLDSVRHSWNDLMAAVRLVGKQFPHEALLSSDAIAHLLPAVPATLFLQLDHHPPLEVDTPARITFALLNPTTMKAALVDDILPTHGAPLHAFVCDETLTDYQHLHPVAEGVNGKWLMTFTPRLPGAYRVWVDIVPRESGREEILCNNITQTPEFPALANSLKVISLTHESGNLRGVLSVPQGTGFHPNTTTEVTLSLTDERGAEVHDLAPYMGAFAHIIGIAEDNYTFFHSHPTGGMPKAGSLGGPHILFNLRPAIHGFYRLFVQVSRNGQVFTLPFGITVD